MRFSVQQGGRNLAAVARSRDMAPWAIRLVVLVLSGRPLFGFHIFAESSTERRAHQ